MMCGWSSPPSEAGCSRRAGEAEEAAREGGGVAWLPPAPEGDDTGRAGVDAVVSAGGGCGRVAGEEKALVMIVVAPFVRGCSQGCVAGGGSGECGGRDSGECDDDGCGAGGDGDCAGCGGAEPVIIVLAEGCFCRADGGG
jgi:hypothetical protein